LEDVEEPEIAPNEVPVHVRAVSLDPTTGATSAPTRAWSA